LKQRKTHQIETVKHHFAKYYRMGGYVLRVNYIALYINRVMKVFNFSGLMLRYRCQDRLRKGNDKIEIEIEVPLQGLHDIVSSMKSILFEQTLLARNFSFY
jgi:hypothetical protein